MSGEKQIQRNPLIRWHHHNSLLKELIKQRYLFFMVLPGFLVVLIFNYFPMYGILIAFKDYNAAKGVIGSPWVGLKHFEMFFANPKALLLLKNTFLLGLYMLIFTFPAPIILALLLNEIKHSLFKRTVQTISYIPHFISVVVIVGMIAEFSSTDGIFNTILGMFGMEPRPLLAYDRYFRPLYVLSEVWQRMGWGSIIYLAAISGVDPTLYDVASIDGANRWQRMRNITWPTILPTTTILLILNMGTIIGYDFQKILLMYNERIYNVADVISTYVYREGIQFARFDYTTAIGLFLSVISFIFVFVANLISRKVSENSLW